MKTAWTSDAWDEYLQWLTPILPRGQERPREALAERPAGCPSPLETQGRLGSFVSRFQFCQVHREVENDLDGFGIWVSVVIAINVYLHLPTVANDTLPPMLEGYLHMIAPSSADIVPDHLGLSIYQEGAGCRRRTRRPLRSVMYSSRMAEAISSAQRRLIAAAGSSQRPVPMAQSAIFFAEVGQGKPSIRYSSTIRCICLT
jgi:hypothetical protein